MKVQPGARCSQLRASLRVVNTWSRGGVIWHRRLMRAGAFVFKGLALPTAEAGTLALACVDLAASASLANTAAAATCPVEDRWMVVYKWVAVRSKPSLEVKISLDKEPPLPPAGSLRVRHNSPDACSMLRALAAFPEGFEMVDSCISAERKTRERDVRDALIAEFAGVQALTVFHLLPSILEEVGCNDLGADQYRPHPVSTCVPCAMARREAEVSDVGDLEPIKLEWTPKAVPPEKLDRGAPRPPTPDFLKNLSFEMVGGGGDAPSPSRCDPPTQPAQEPQPQDPSDPPDDKDAVPASQADRRQEAQRAKEEDRRQRLISEVSRISRISGTDASNFMRMLELNVGYTMKELDQRKRALVLLLHPDKAGTLAQDAALEAQARRAYDAVCNAYEAAKNQLSWQSPAPSGPHAGPPCSQPPPSQSFRNQQDWIALNAGYWCFLRTDGSFRHGSAVAGAHTSGRWELQEPPGGLTLALVLALLLDSALSVQVPQAFLAVSSAASFSRFPMFRTAIADYRPLHNSFHDAQQQRLDLSPEHFDMSLPAQHEASSERTEVLKELAASISPQFQTVELDLLDEAAFVSLLKDGRRDGDVGGQAAERAAFLHVTRPSVVFHLAGIFRRVPDPAK
ncbi:Parp2, partial [Symbiodinium necroappetens]